MSNFRDLIARMAIDPEFARHTRANPDAVARQYQLSHDESEQLRGLADAAASAGPTALGARLSKMGGLTSAALSTPFFTGPDTDHDGILDVLDTDDDNDGIPDATDSHPLEPNLLLAKPHLPTGPIVTLDPDILNPTGDADGDKIPNFLDGNDNSTNTTHEAWGDNDHDKIPNLDDSDTGGEFAGYRIALSLAPDSDGDGIQDPIDSNDHSLNTTNEALGDNDHDGIYNYLDKKFNVHLPVDGIPPLVLDPGDGGSSTPPPPPPGDSTPPPPPGDSTPPAPTGGDGPSTPDIIVNVDAPAAGQAAPAPQQPILLADDALAKPVAAPAASEDGGVGAGLLLAGGAAALAAGAVAGGVAGKVFGDKSKDEE